MIEVLSIARCTECDICVRVCPTNVFDSVPGAAPVIARHDSCQTCYQCEAYCPADAIYVAPLRDPAPAGSVWRDEAVLTANDQLGLYRDMVGWGKGRTLPTEPLPTVNVMQLIARRHPAAPRAAPDELLDDPLGS